METDVLDYWQVLFWYRSCLWLWRNHSISRQNRFVGLAWKRLWLVVFMMKAIIRLQGGSSYQITPSLWQQIVQADPDRYGIARRATSDRPSTFKQNPDRTPKPGNQCHASICRVFRTNYLLTIVSKWEKTPLWGDSDRL